MDRTLTEDKVREALKHSSSGKAPGPNGLPYELWKHLEEAYQMKSKSHNERNFNIIQVLKQVYNDIAIHGKCEQGELTDGWICPIYKKGDRRHIENYRPITVLNSDFKFMSKTTSMKLIKVAPNTIHKDQAGFLPNRSIFNQTRLTIEMINHCEADLVNGVVVALGQEKRTIK